LNPTTIQIIGAALFAVAILHTFATKFFEGLAHKHPRHAGIWHLLGEVEVVFGFWALVLVLCMAAVLGKSEATAYIDTRNFTEPLFVFAIMVVAGTRPIIEFAKTCVRLTARAVPLPHNAAYFFTVMSLVPLLGSFITEPAAMTLAALIRRHLEALHVRHAGRTVRQHLHRRYAHAFRCAAGAHGCRHLELGHRLHVHYLRLEGGHRGRHQCNGRHADLPQGAGRNQGPL
jgi:hypothetical protein